MCTNKVCVEVPHTRGKSYFPCGKCPECRQRFAVRRARKIKMHKPADTVCYFLTLTYRNEHIPYIRKSELSYALKNLPAEINVYRDKDIRFFKGRRISYDTPKVLSKFELTDFYTYSYEEIFNQLSTLRSKISDQEFSFDDDKISVAFNKDAQNFVKRLRTNLSRDHKMANTRFSYYFSPEYGPDTQRYHIHFLLWFPSFAPFSRLCAHITKAWPYADRRRTIKYFQPVISDASHYVASYVNCDNTVSDYLKSAFPLRSSHSLFFGFGEKHTTFKSLYEAYQRQSFTFPSRRYTPNGVVDVDLPYPKYIIDKYVPFFKGINRITYDQALRTLVYPEQYLRLSIPEETNSRSTKIDRTTLDMILKSYPGLTEKEFYRRVNLLYPSARFLDSGIIQYRTQLIDKYGDHIFMSPGEARYTINKINRAYSYFKEYFPDSHNPDDGFSNYNRYDFAIFVLDFWTKYRNFIYKQISGLPPLRQLYFFYNLSECVNHYNHDYTGEDIGIRNDSLEHLARVYRPDTLDPNQFPDVRAEHEYYMNMYRKNIKTRKLNALNN